MTGTSPATEFSRDFTVAVFVVDNGNVLLHFHRKLGRWLPPGGHIEPDELPDEAATREVLEETGVTVQLVGDTINSIDVAGQPIQLCRPAGIQLARIRPGHEHIDIVYFAKATHGSPSENSGWYGPNSWSSLELTAEVTTWCEAAIKEVDRWTPIFTRVRT